MFYLMGQKKGLQKEGGGSRAPQDHPPPLRLRPWREKKCGEIRMKMKNSRGREEKIEEERRRGWEGKGEEEHDGQEAMTEKNDVN